MGHRYEQHLHKLNIHTIGDLAGYPAAILKKKFGLYGETLWLSANGIDSSPVDPDSLNRVKSIGQQITLPRDYKGNEIKVVILELADLVAHRVRARVPGEDRITHPQGHQLLLAFPDADLKRPTDLAADISAAAFDLLQALVPAGLCVWWEYPWPTSSLPAGTGRIIRQQGKTPGIEKACDQVRERYGRTAVFRAVSLKEGCLEHVRYL